MPKILAFDVETPNSRNDRICAIGISILNNGAVEKTEYYLVNPECSFDDRNIEIHGIHPYEVADAPTFPELWETISTYFSENLLVAHNAIFDLSVLSKTLLAYGLDAPTVYYVCTLNMSRILVKETENHKLNTLCAYYDIPLDHHNAGSDSNACAEILLRLLKKQINLDEYIEAFDLSKSCNSASKAPRKLSADTIALQTLSSLLQYISEDGILSNDEVEFLKIWLDRNQSLKGNFPYDKIYATVEAALEDGVLDGTEIDEMMGLFSKVANPVDACACNEHIDIQGKNICLSGEFVRGTKNDVKQELTEMGATIQNSVSGKTDVLIVGDLGNDAWCAGNYGTKVKKAMELKEKGADIIIVREKEFFMEH